MLKFGYHRGNIANHQDYDVFSELHSQSDRQINTVCVTTADQTYFDWDRGKIEFLPVQDIDHFLQALADDFDILDTSEFYRDYSQRIINFFPKKKTVTVFDNLPFGISRGYAGELSEKVDAVIARAPMVQRMLEAEGVPRKKTFLVPSAVDVDLFKPSYLTGSFPTILFVGRVVPEKGLWDLILAMSGLEGVDLEVAGEGDFGPYIELAKLARVNIKFLGNVQHKDLPGIMHRASILAVPSIPKIDVYNPEASWVEQFGVVLLEGMACGLPIVVSDTGNTRDIIIDGEEGFLFPPRSWDILRHRLELLLKNHALRNRMGSRGRDRVVKMFSTKVVGKQLAEVYGNL